MRNHTKSFLVLALTVAVAGNVGMALAKGKNPVPEPPVIEESAPVQPGVSGYDDNNAYRALTPDQKAQYNNIIRATEEAMIPLREQMMAKRLEMQTMASMPNMDHEAIARVAREIAAIHTSMVRVHDMMADRLAGELGINVRRGTCFDGYTGCDMHRGMMGRGMMNGGMMGRGMMQGTHHQGMMQGPGPVVPNNSMPMMNGGHMMHGGPTQDMDGPMPIMPAY